MHSFANGLAYAHSLCGTFPEIPTLMPAITSMSNCQGGIWNAVKVSSEWNNMVEVGIICCSTVYHAIKCCNSYLALCSRCAMLYHATDSECHAFSMLTHVWLCGAVVRALDLRLEVAGSIPAAALSSATLVKLWTHIVQRLWCYNLMALYKSV